MKNEWKTNDEVWIYMSNHHGNRTKGKVLEKLDLQKHGITIPYYLILVPCHIDILLEVRHDWQMWREQEQTYEENQIEEENDEGY